ncbi:MAG TPA: aldolase [Candidatus Limnocylindria bacterium]|nr:aldolase [Candidatus Limnocylindria bacterium]
MNPIIPADIPKNKHSQFQENYTAITRNTDKLFLFACDQKIEHLNKDFYGDGIAPEANNPEHIFKIAAGGNVGALATHFGLLARYGSNYPNVNYIVKLNGKTDIIQPQKPSAWWSGPSYAQIAKTHALLQDPVSTQLWSVQDVVNLKQESGLPIRGVGFTIYLGSVHEQTMLAQAAQIIYQAHQHGLVTIIWIYPRGIAVKDDQEQHLLAGAAGVAASLGADFVKIKQPRTADDLAIACAAAGNTKVLCAGGQTIKPEELLRHIANNLQAGAAGCAVGRNIFQKNQSDAIALTQALAALVYQNMSVEQALAHYQQTSRS